MNFQMYESATALIATGKKNTERSRCLVFTRRLSPSARARPSAFVVSTKMNAISSVWKSAFRVVELRKISSKLASPTQCALPMPSQLVNAYHPPAIGAATWIVIAKTTPGTRSSHGT